METRDSYQRALIDACTIIGDEAELAERLGCAVPEVLDWYMGVHPVPVRVFHDCVDILIDSHRRRIDDTEFFLNEVRRRTGLAPRDGIRPPG